MNAIPNSLQELIDEFSKLPGIGRKTAERLSIHMLKNSIDNIDSFISVLKNLKENIQNCNICHAFIDSKCEICNDVKRNNKIICVVKDPVDIFLIEKSGYNGLYHVLNGLISPLDGIKPEDLNIDSLITRLNNIDEVVLGIEPSSEGDVTNLYLTKIFKDYKIKVTRLARGIPIGTSLEFLDEVTLAHSIKDRVEIK